MLLLSCGDSSTCKNTTQKKIVNVMIINTSILELKLLVLNSFRQSNYDTAMNEAVQLIEDMVFDSTAARTIYWAIFDDLVDSDELYRKKLVSTFDEET